MSDEAFMERCFQLAEQGEGRVSPNPMVGAVLVHEGRIIGEGFHQQWGEAHAEVNCLRSVSPENQALIPYSTLYCNLEPCAHHGKTPPCSDLIIASRIPRVVIANLDPNPLVAGKGLEKMRAAGIKLKSGVLEGKGHWLNRSFFTWIEQKRPWIVLKWAESADGYIGLQGERTHISGPVAQRLVHRWRAACDAILVGSHTALTDNPKLDTRRYFGKNPLRVTVDRSGQLSDHHYFLDDSTLTWIYGPPRPHLALSQTLFLPVAGKLDLPTLLQDLYNAGKAILLVEGGATLIRDFIAQGLWDEIRVIRSANALNAGISAPELPDGLFLREEFVLQIDTIRTFARSNTA